MTITLIFYKKEMVILLRIDKAILDTSGVICDNIARFGATERGLLSQRIETPSRFSYAVTYNDRYYVQKIKP